MPLFKMGIDPRLELSGRRHGLASEQPHHPRVRSNLRENIVEYQRLRMRGCGRGFEAVGLGQEQLAIRLKPVGRCQQQLIGMDFNLSEVEYRNREPLLTRGDGTKRAAAQEIPED